jgi:cytochrome c peroxidase
MNDRRTRAAAALWLVVAGGVACRRTPPPPPATPQPAPAAAHKPYVWRLPAGIPEPVVPADNPMSDAKVDLGRRLFYDTRLSQNQTYACATCHQQRHAFTDGRARAVGSTGGLHPRSAMTLTNAAYNVSYGWADPSLRTLEGQMRVPLLNEHPIEMGLAGHEAEILQRFQTADDRARFAAAFPADDPAVTLANAIKAIASFERTMVSGNSPLDRYLYRDDRTALSGPALGGMKLFFSKRLRCSECHAGFNLSGPIDFALAKNHPRPAFHNTGLYDVDGKGSYPDGDRGLRDVTRHSRDMGQFRAPTLRNIAVTAPYMHDGSIATLEGVLDHYASGGHRSRFRSRAVRGFRLTAAERADLLAFLNSLTDQAFLDDPALARH